MLSNDAWVEEQMAGELSHSVDLEKLIRMEQLKVSQAKLRVSKVQEGWEKGFYTPEEVQLKLTEQREAIARAESEIGRLREHMCKSSAYQVRKDRILGRGLKLLP
jgi:hypothetical protein